MKKKKRDNDEDRGSWMDPERLMLAVDAIFYAFEEMLSEELPLRHPMDLMGAPDQPGVLCEFTRDEIEQASRFLERMGMLGRGRRPGRGGLGWAA